MKQIDARKKVCPIPVVMAKEAMETEQEIQVIVDNFVAVQNIEKMARVKGYACSHAASGEDYLVTLSRNGQPDTPAAAQPAGQPVLPAECCQSASYAVVINKEGMGQGDPVLSKKLLSAFFFALTKQDILPAVILFYNQGAYYTCQDSPLLEDLRTLEKMGVRILTCGTCLDYYGLKEKLVIGGVSNMYEIVETMAAADKVIVP